MSIKRLTNLQRKVRIVRFLLDILEEDRGIEASCLYVAGLDETEDSIALLRELMSEIYADFRRGVQTSWPRPLGEKK